MYVCAGYLYTVIVPWLTCLVMFIGRCQCFLLYAIVSCIVSTLVMVMLCLVGCRVSDRGGVSDRVTNGKSGAGAYYFLLRHSDAHITWGVH